MSGGAASIPQIAGLWPAPARITESRSTGSDETGYLVVPSMSRPRLLVPADLRGAERMFSRHGGGRLDRAARRAWRQAHRSGLAARLPLSRLSVASEPEGIEAYLAGVLGEDVRIGVLLGPPRANLKPVVQVFSADGDTIAFAKVGLTPLTTKLLAAEAAALELLATKETHTFSVPALLHHGSWKDNPVLVQSALPLAQGDHAPAVPPLEVMVEIAGVAGVTNQPLTSSDVLGAPPENRDWHGLDLRVFVALHETLTASGDLPFGTWHGDFGPWNMGVDGRRVEVWDWERFAVGVPVGFDAAHYQAQRGVAAGTDPVLAWHRILADVEAVLHASGLDESVGPAVGSAYLLAIVDRYRGDAADGPTDRLRARLTWLAAVGAVARGQIQELAR
jgi:hypothetical protein